MEPTPESQGPGSGAPGGGGPAAPAPDLLRRVHAPAIGLIVNGILGIAFGMIGLAFTLFGSGADWAGQVGQLPEQVARALEVFSNVVVSVIWAVFGGLVDAFIIFAGIRMLAGRGYGLALAGAILSVIPCFGCCCVGVPIGIWALVILLGAGVKERFAA